MSGPVEPARLSEARKAQAFEVLCEMVKALQSTSPRWLLRRCSTLYPATGAEVCFLFDAPWPKEPGYSSCISVRWNRFSGWHIRGETCQGDATSRLYESFHAAVGPVLKRYTP